MTQEPRTNYSLAIAALVATNLCWAGNWVAGRAMRTEFGPFALTFWRWVITIVVLAPLAWGGVRTQWPLIRRHWKLLATLSMCFVVFFPAMIYIGLRSTTAINAVVLNACIPLVTLIVAMIVDKQRTTARQVAGMLLSMFCVFVIVMRADWERFKALDFHEGDIWILVATPLAALYAVLLRRKPPELRGTPLVFALAVIGLIVLTPAYLLEMLLWIPQGVPTIDGLIGVGYIGVFASVVALATWNYGVSAVGAARAGVTVNLTPMFGTVIAILFLGETLQLFHVVGFAGIVAGVALAQRK